MRPCPVGQGELAMARRDHYISRNMKWQFGNMGSISSRNMTWELCNFNERNLSNWKWLFIFNQRKSAFKMVWVWDSLAAGKMCHNGAECCKSSPRTRQIQKIISLALLNSKVLLDSLESWTWHDFSNIRRFVLHLGSVSIFLTNVDLPYRTPVLKGCWEGSWTNQSVPGASNAG